MNVLKSDGLLRGSLSPQEQMELITGTDQLAEAVKDAIHIQVRFLLAFQGIQCCQDVQGQLNKIRQTQSVFTESANTATSPKPNRNALSTRRV